MILVCDGSCSRTILAPAPDTNGTGDELVCASVENENEKSNFSVLGGRGDLDSLTYRDGGVLVLLKYSNSCRLWPLEKFLGLSILLAFRSCHTITADLLCGIYRV